MLYENPVQLGRHSKVENGCPVSTDAVLSGNL